MIERRQKPSNGAVDCPKKCTVWELAHQLFPNKSGQTAGAFINNQTDLSDLRTPLNKGDQVQFVFIPSEEALQVVRHSSAHVMAQAVQELWPEVKVTIGPVIKNGFYYDFDSPKKFRPEDLEKIEQKMHTIIKSKLEVTKHTWPKEKAISFFKKMGEHYKVEIIKDINKPQVSVYQQGEWIDLCKGPHVKNLSQIGAVKVLHQSGAYWRGEETSQQLQRIYGTAFHSEKDLKKHLRALEDAARFDHRRLGKEMGLFYFSDLAPGSPFFTSAGTVIYNELKKFLKVMYKKYGYQEVITPQIFEEELFKKSGHKEHFADNMYPVQTDTAKAPSPRQFYLKPMNCPGHCLLYSLKKHSYRDLPWRAADFGRLHRREKKGTLHGLTRVNSLCQDDAHVFCPQNGLKKEIKLCLDMFHKIYSQLGLTDFTISLSTRPKKSMGKDTAWQAAETALTEVLTASGVSHRIQKGEGAFYGPKLDWHITDAMGRPWQLGTLQCDFNMPKAFNLHYTDTDNKEKTPILLHRAVLGSLERFIGVYLEHTKGKLPLWLSPVSVLLINVSQAQEDYALEIKSLLQKLGVRVQADLRSEKVGYKIRESRLQRIPCIGVVGEKEKQAGSVCVRFPNGTMDSVNKQDFARLAARAAHDRIHHWMSVWPTTNQSTKEVPHSQVQKKV